MRIFLRATDGSRFSRAAHGPCAHAAAGALIALITCGGCAQRQTLTTRGLWQPDYDRFGEADAVQFTQIARKRRLVYTRLAEYLIERFDLSSRPGIGIDIGGGPGDLVFELAARTREFYWLNADINTWYAHSFAEDALQRKLAHRTGFVFADACALPFRERYADLIVSRGSYQFWGNLEEGVREIHRVLRPGGWAIIGRGFPPTMPEDEVRALYERRVVGGPQYDPDEDAAVFRSLMQKMNVEEYEVIRHQPGDPSLRYGVWLCFQRHNL